jgi:hypothetical protein
MREHVRRRLALAGCLLLGAGVFLRGIDWGLPSRRVDPCLFGDHPVWTGAEIARLAPPRPAGGQGGADVDVNPLAAGASAGPVVVNATDAERAEIVRRYRLYTYQPDEMITLMSLSGMRPGSLQLDPKLYQYGGLWIYPVGGMLKGASLVHLVDLRGGPEGVAYYLDHPEAFGRFYVVARLYVVLWALVGVWAVFELLRRLVGGIVYPAVAASLFAVMPVVVNMAHEAKPHLPGAVLVLLAVLTAARFVENGSRRAWLAAGALCGASFGMVLSMLPVFAVLPAMVLLRPMRVADRVRIAMLAALLGVAVYLATNPYVLLNQFTASGRETLHSNLENSSAMYHVGRPLAGAINAAGLVAEGASPLLALAGAIGAIALGVRAVRLRQDSSPEWVSRRAVGLMLAAPAVLIAIQSAMLAAGKPGEFGRFLLVPDVFLGIEAVVAAVTFVRPATGRLIVLAVLCLGTALAGGIYLHGFVRDGRPVTSRLAAAERLRQLNANGARTMAMTADPAPYCLPPVDLFTWQIVKVSATAAQRPQPETDVLVRPVDVSPGATPGVPQARISWADKQFEIVTRAP